MIPYTLARGLHTVDFFYLTESDVSMDHLHSVFLCLIIFGVIFILALVLGKRSACHYLCPLSVLNIAGSAIKNTVLWPSLHMEANPENCTGCKRCSKAYPMSLDVAEMVQSGKPDHSECILCGECFAACGSGTTWKICKQRLK